MSVYFADLSRALKAAEIFRPCLVLDRDRLDGNIALVKDRLAPGLAVRLVDKSLPCLPLLSHIAKALGTNRFMTFHPPVTQAVLDAFPEGNLLYGKPLPVGAAKAALSRGGAGWWSRVCWLIDTPERLAEYGALAAALDTELRFAFEVGVEREDRTGRLGVPDIEIVEGEVGVLFQLGEAGLLELEGVVGVHVVDADDTLSALQQALRHMHPEEAGRAGDENGHGIRLPVGRLADK